MKESLFGRVFLMPGRSLLEQDIKQIRQRMLQWVFEYDELRYKDVVFLENQFYLHLGEDHLALLEKHYQAEYLRCLLKDVEANQYLDIDESKRKLDRQFKTYQVKIQEEKKKIDEAITWSYEPEIPIEDSRLMRKYYRKAVEALHPSLHPLQSQTQKQLFQTAVSAYKRNDLSILEMVYDNLQEEYVQERRYSLAEMVDLRYALLAASYEVQLEIAKVRSDCPYAIRYHILVEEHCERIRQGMRAKVERLEAKILVLESKLRDLTS